jgi:predicted transposase/invertase (TIGR01784 family)
MKKRTFISFDWAIKKVLRHKENFVVLEGFLSELLGFDMKIVNILESESNRQTPNDKQNRVDILVKSSAGELILVEVQYDDEIDYFHRMVFGISKLITEYLSESQEYGEIKKAFSINILYFRLGQGKDYIYEYRGSFVGLNQKDTLLPTKAQQAKFNIKTVADLFPKYYIIRVGSFKKEEVQTPLDEWVYFLKNSEIKDSFKAKGMDEAKQVLNFHNMDEQDRVAYDQFVKNQRIGKSVWNTAIGKGERKQAIETAKIALEEGATIPFVVKITKLTLDEVQRIANGEDIDKPSDDDVWEDVPDNYEPLL